MNPRPACPERRRLLQSLARAPLPAMAAGPAWAQAGAESVGLITPNVCLVATELTEGPFYLDPELVRQDITEGREGVPLELALQVVDVACQPVDGARVDIWQCDARGNYAGFAMQGSDERVDTEGERFLRGTQFAGPNGVATLRTIYPGWYRGRTPHIHYKVFLDERPVLTSQIIFPDALSQYIYEHVPPYTERRGVRQVFNRDDRIAQRAGPGAHASIREEGDGYAAALVVSIDPQA